MDASNVNRNTVRNWWEQPVTKISFHLMDELPDSVYQCFDAQLASMCVLVVRGEALQENAVYVRVPLEPFKQWILVRPYLDDSPYYWNKPVQQIFDLDVLTQTALGDWDENFKTIGANFSRVSRGVDLSFMFWQSIIWKNMYTPGCLFRQTITEIQKINRNITTSVDTYADPSLNKTKEEKTKENTKENTMSTTPRSGHRAEQPAIRPTIHPKSVYSIPQFTVESIELTPPAHMFRELELLDGDEADRQAAHELILSRYIVRDIVKGEDRFLVEDMGSRFDKRLRLARYNGLFTHIICGNAGTILLAGPHPVGNVGLAPVGYAAIIEEDGIQNTVIGAKGKKGGKGGKKTTASPKTTLVSLAVNPDHRRQGIGTKLFLTALHRARRTLQATVFTTGRHASPCGLEFLGSVCQRINNMVGFSTKTYLATIDGAETLTLEVMKQ